jgi:hypothetical protein
VELLLEVSQHALSAALGALATGYVRRFLERAKPSRTPRSGSGAMDYPKPDVRPLMGLTIVNQSGGTVVVLNPQEGEDALGKLERVMDPHWRGSEEVL